MSPGGMLLSAALVVLVTWAWMLWDRRRDTDQSPEPAPGRRWVRRYGDGELGELIIKGLSVAFVILLSGLLLDTLGIDAGGYVVLGAFALSVVVLYLLPLWPSRRD